MGSKISFSRKRSDQYTLSERTTVTSHPHSLFHTPTDCKEVFQDTDCNEENNDSEWEEEMNVTNVRKPLPASVSSETQNPEGPDDGNCQSNGASQFEMDANAEMAAASVRYLTSDNHGLPVVGPKKSGRSRNIKHPKLEDKMYSLSGELVTDQHKEISTKIQMPSCSESQNAEAVPNNVKNLINELAHNEATRIITVPAHKQGDDVPLVSTRKRARTKRSDIPVIENIVSKAPFLNGLVSPSPKVQSQGGHPSAPEKNSCSVVAPKEMDVSLSPISSTTASAIETSDLQIDHQTPAKVFKLDVSQVSGDTCLRSETQIEKLQVSNGQDRQTCQAKNSGECDAHQQVGRDGEYPQINVGGDRGELSLQSVEGGTRKVCMLPLCTELEKPEGAEGALAQFSKLSVQETFRSSFEFNKFPKMQPVADESLRQPACQSICHPSKSVLSPLTREPSDIADSLGEPCRTPEVPSAVKVENIEAQLDDLDSQQSAKMCQYRQHTIFRRKKGHKRRRRITVLIRQESKGETQHKIESCETNSVAEKNLAYVRKGSKTFLQCAICNRTYKFMSQYIVHQRVHTGERPFKCPECKRGFSKKSNLNLHLKTHMKNSLKKECPYCKIKFSDDTYDSHMTMHTQVQEIDDFNLNRVDSPVERPQAASTPDRSESKVCQYCRKSFKFQSALVRHERVHTGEKPYKCGICGKAFGQSYFLRVHELTHWSVKRYNCTTCKKSFSHYSNAKNHTCRPLGSGSETQPGIPVAKNSLTYTCHICKNVLDSLPKFNKHMSGHTGAKLYRCLCCDKLFGVRSEFNAHCSLCYGGKNGSCAAVKEEDRMSVVEYTVSSQRISTERKSDPLAAIHDKRSQSRMNCKKPNSVKPFRPTVQPTRLLSPFVSKLNKLDNRSDPRSYLCPNCGRLFRHVGRLRAHMLTHAPHQSYACSSCGKTLENWTKLWHHQRVHRQRRGRFVCSLCGKRFRFVESYKKHMNEHPDFHWIHSKPKTVFLPYHCDHCTSRFKTLDLLFSHQVCHFSAQITRIDPVSNQSPKYGSTQSNTVLNATKKHPSCPEPENDANPVWQAKNFSILTLNSTGQKQDFTLDQHGQSHRTKCSMREDSPNCRRKDGNVMKKQKANWKTANRHTFPNIESSQGLFCAICGKEYTALSDLYHHYLKHARGQIK